MGKLHSYHPLPHSFPFPLTWLCLEEDRRGGEVFILLPKGKRPGILVWELRSSYFSTQEFEGLATSKGGATGRCAATRADNIQLVEMLTQAPVPPPLPTPC